MPNIIIKFDKSLVIPQQDYEIFLKENYKINDGTVHIFDKSNNTLLVLENEKIPKLFVHFNEKKLENKQYYELKTIKYMYSNDFDPSTEKAQGIVFNIITEVFELLDNIILKRDTPKNDENDVFYNYIIYDENTHIFDKLITKNHRCSYLQLLPKLEYLFGITN